MRKVREIRKIRKIRRRGRLIRHLLGAVLFLGLLEPRFMTVSNVLAESKATFKMALTSSVFSPGEAIPKTYTGEGKDLSPPLEWSGVPKGTQELALICEDPDAPSPQPWVHWVVYHISSHLDHLPEGIPQSKKVNHPVHLEQGVNSFGKMGYNGPMPPKGHGWHRYFFTLYALDSKINLEPGADKQNLLTAMHGHILGQTLIVGRYKRD